MVLSKRLRSLVVVECNFDIGRVLDQGRNWRMKVDLNLRSAEGRHKRISRPLAAIVLRAARSPPADDRLHADDVPRSEMNGDFIQVNGDNVFRSDLVERLLAAPANPVSVAINVKQAYDADDMKVMMDRGRLTEVGKTLPVDTVNAEAIGFYVFRGDGVKAYRDELELAMRDPQGLKRWFPSAVGSLAKKVTVSTIECTGLRWAEVDFPADLTHARNLVAGWDQA